MIINAVSYTRAGDKFSLLWKICFMSVESLLILSLECVTLLCKPYIYFPQYHFNRSNDTEDRSSSKFLVKSIQPLLLSETQDPQQHEHQDGEGQGPYEDVLIGMRVQGPTWKSQRHQISQLQHALTMCQWTQLTWTHISTGEINRHCVIGSTTAFGQRTSALKDLKSHQWWQERLNRMDMNDINQTQIKQMGFSFKFWKTWGGNTIMFLKFGVRTQLRLKPTIRRTHRKRHIKLTLNSLLQYKTDLPVFSDEHQFDGVHPSRADADQKLAGAVKLQFK